MIGPGCIPLISDALDKWYGISVERRGKTIFFLTCASDHQGKCLYLRVREYSLVQLWLQKQRQLWGWERIRKKSASQQGLALSGEGSGWVIQVLVYKAASVLGLARTFHFKFWTGYVGDALARERVVIELSAICTRTCLTWPRLSGKLRWITAVRSIVRWYLWVQSRSRKLIVTCRRR